MIRQLYTILDTKNLYQTHVEIDTARIMAEVLRKTTTVFLLYKNAAPCYQNQEITDTQCIYTIDQNTYLCIIHNTLLVYLLHINKCKKQRSNLLVIKHANKFIQNH